MSTGYENAASTLMLATHCCACGRQLRDTDSVQAGMGEKCREKHGYGVATAPPRWEAIDPSALPDADAARAAFAAQDAHKLSNVLVHYIAYVQASPEARTWIAMVHALGYTRVAEALCSRLGVVVVTDAGEQDIAGRRVVALAVRAPMNMHFCHVLYHAGVRSRWDGDAGVRYVAKGDAPRLWRVLKETFAVGTVVIGTKGSTVIGPRAAVAA
jgi:hypothetical protein